MATQGGDAGDLAKAFRSVQVEPMLRQTMPQMAKQVNLLARANLRSVPGSFSRAHAQLGKYRDAGLQLQGLLAVVAEYGMNGRHWFYWGRWRNATPVPPPRAAFGRRPKPDEGHVIGKAYKQLAEDLHEFGADQLWSQYGIAFDQGKIYKVRGSASG